jgi:hypothetical protein
LAEALLGLATLPLAGRLLESAADGTAGGVA